MSPERWQQIDRLYHDALERKPEERTAFLAGACQGDQDLHREVLSLLAADSSTDILNRPAWDVAPSLLERSATQITPGAQLGPYQIEELLGAGGMGEVYRARDTRLHRTVAIKLLPNEQLADADRKLRFLQEARAASALSHPNIVTLYDIASGNGRDFLVLEYVAGKTLAQLITPKGLPIGDALHFATQIANALAAAHAAGIVHRDIKPANVVVTAEGQVKVLDFGLAKLQPSSAARAALAGPETAHTAPGVVMGTPAYMSPEQAAAREADHRTDIFSLGVVLYELLSGVRPFRGASQVETLHAILNSAAPPLAPARPDLPPEIDEILGKALAKDPRERYQHAGDFELDLRRFARAWKAKELPTQRVTAPAVPALPRRRFIVSAAAIILIIAAGAAVYPGLNPNRPSRGAVFAPVERPLTRLSVDLGPDAMPGLDITAAISPDGRRLVFPARGPNGKPQLATRLLDQSQASLLPGTEDGQDPFFSPDSQWIGFFADDKIKKVSVQGGAPVAVCYASYHYGASWGEDGNMVASLYLLAGLYRVPAAGGRPQPLTKLGKDEVTHRWPQVLPGAQAILFTASPGGFAMENASIEVLSLKGGAVKTLAAGYFGRYLPANGSRGYLVYIRQGTLFGVAFDSDRLELQGTPTPLLSDVAANPATGGGQFDLSLSGTLMYLPGHESAQTTPVMWLDNSGKMQPLLAKPGLYVLPRFSPDGQRLALTVSTNNGTDIYSYDWRRETMTRLTMTGRAQMPIWTPDGKHIAFQSRAGGFGIWWIRSDGSGEAERLLEAQNNTTPHSFSPNGRRLAYFEFTFENGFDLLTLPLDPSDPDHPIPGKPEPFLQTTSDELVPVFSPDGRWIAYRSNESGINEVYVRPFPAGAGGKWQISTGGGLYGIWSNNGRELFYETSDNRIMVVDYTVNGDSFVPGKPRTWSQKKLFWAGASNLALHPDGKRFAVLPMPEAAGPEKGTVHVTFLENFVDELRHRIPVKP